MTYKILVRPEAEEELEQAFLWYENKRKGLGHDFLFQVGAGLRIIQSNPEIHPEEYKNQGNI